MKLVEQHIITRSDKNWKQIDQLCFLSKNLYNASLYFIKNYYEINKKFIRYNQLYKELKENIDFKNLPIDSSQQILMLMDKNIKSYLSILKKWKANKYSLSGCPQFAKYKNKLKGRNILVFTFPNQIRVKENFIHFPKKINLQPIQTKITSDKIKQVRIIPKSSHYIIEIVYEKFIQDIDISKVSDNYLSIDLGLNNLVTCFDSKSKKSFIINGKPLKSINQYFNKKKAKLQSQLKINHNKYNSKKIDKLSLKRSNKIKNYLHNSSRFIVNYCKTNNISHLVIGHNKEWKQNINLGKKNNQNFVFIPFNNFIDQLKYKCQLEGIVFQETEESYTSKCSSIDLEELKHQENYLGKRIKRGLFMSKNGIRINADLNGALNILRKVNPDKGSKTIQTLRTTGQVIWPVKTTSSQNKMILNYKKL